MVDLFNRCTAKYPADRPDIKEVVQVKLLGFPSRTARIPILSSFDTSCGCQHLGF